MKKSLFWFVIVLTLSMCIFAQEAKKEKAQATEADKTAVIPTDAFLKRGAPIGKSEKIALSKVFAEPAKYAGKTVTVEGVARRSPPRELANRANPGETRGTVMAARNRRRALPLDRPLVVLRVRCHCVRGSSFEPRQGSSLLVRLSTRAFRHVSTSARQGGPRPGCRREAGPSNAWPEDPPHVIARTEPKRVRRGGT